MRDKFEQYKSANKDGYLFIIKTNKILKDSIGSGSCEEYSSNRSRLLGWIGSPYRFENIPKITKNYYKDPQILEMFITNADVSENTILKKIDRVYTRVEYGDQFILAGDYDLKIQYH